MKVLSNSDLSSNTKEELSKKCTLVHGGGWKNGRNKGDKNFVNVLIAEQESNAYRTTMG